MARAVASAEEAKKEAIMDGAVKEGDAEKKDGAGETAAEGDKKEDGVANGTEEKKDEAQPMEDEEEPQIDFAEIDVFGVKDILDVGGGMPLFKDFAFEDWTMTSL